MLIVIAVLFLAIDSWGHISRVYVTSPYIDVVTHILFGAWLALALIYRNSAMSRASIFLIVFIVGLGWEFLELMYDQLYATPHGTTFAQHGLTDTLKDIFDNGVGVLISFLIFRRPSGPLSAPIASVQRISPDDGAPHMS